MKDEVELFGGPCHGDFLPKQKFFARWIECPVVTEEQGMHYAVYESVGGGIYVYTGPRLPWDGNDDEG